MSITEQSSLVRWWASQVLTIPVSVDVGMSFLLQSLLVVVFASMIIRAHGSSRRLPIKSVHSKETLGRRNDQNSKAFVEKDGIAGSRAVPKKGQELTVAEEMQLHKDLYFKVQNLERYPEILPLCRELLISWFSETLSQAHEEPKSSILSVKCYSRDGLASFLRREMDVIAERWQQYLDRRKAGSPMELFKDREEAIWWLKQHAPVKYVDGAWLGHINKITTPFALRRATKDAWQVLSEELGDGDQDKNHVYVYRELMREIQVDLSDGDHPDFIHPRHQLDEPRVWKAAVAQLLISLFPHDFLPEILGFNMHFELITQETLKAAKELKEMKLNAYYFILHISIDNADSGHTAIAMQTVADYIDHIRRTQGDVEAQQAWKRVQAGYILSEGLAAAAECPSFKKAAVDSFPRDEHEAKVIQIFRGKVSAAHKIHCSSTMKIGRRTLVDWLEPACFASKQWQMDFLDDLSKQKPWVCKGNGSQSRLIRELSWRGKMFGSFTQAEVEAVKEWIDSLRDPDPRFYWSFVDRTEISQDHFFRHRDIWTDYPVIVPNHLSVPPASQLSASTSLDLDAVVKIADSPKASNLLPLWFSHPCLLESFVCIPYKTTTKTASSIVCFLRAQSGFDVEGSGVAGMDEVRRTESVGLVELGLEITRRSGLAEPTCLKDVLSAWPSDFATWMLHLSMRPMANTDLLLGLAWAFVGLHDAVASSSSTTHSPSSTPLLSSNSQEVLRRMASRERNSLIICLEELKRDQRRYADFCRGFGIGKAEIENSLH